MNVSIIPDVIPGKSKIQGSGAFAGRHFNSGDVIFDWSDYYVVRGDDLRMDDKALQVAPDLFMPKYPGCVDDMVNHSCDPSSAVVIRDGKVQLKAIRPINAMSEITFDYSITMLDDEWSMKCLCGAKKCRGVILEYRKLPADVRERYEWMKIVPEYVIPSNGHAG
jgi:hypothetical protein